MPSLRHSAFSAVTRLGILEPLKLRLPRKAPQLGVVAARSIDIGGSGGNVGLFNRREEDLLDVVHTGSLLSFSSIEPPCLF